MSWNAGPTPRAQGTAEEWGRVACLDGTLICEGRVTFGSGESVLIYINAWFERRIREARGFLHCQRQTYSVELLYYTDALLAAALRPAPEAPATTEV